MSTPRPDPSIVTVVEFDFVARTERPATLDRVRSAMDDGRFVWIDLDTLDSAAAAPVLDQLALLSEEMKRDVLSSELKTHYVKLPDCMHLILTACLFRDGMLTESRVDVVRGERFLLTAHDGPLRFLAEVRRQYGRVFVQDAGGPDFLVYELWDRLIEDYHALQSRFEERVQAVQNELLGEVDDTVFQRVASLGAEILYFRNVLVPARTVLAELSMRRTALLTEPTQAILATMVPTLERVLADLVVDRDILSDALNLHMSMTGHRTNRVMNRLTVVSTFFLPLTFLCGVYGTNFEFMPEVHWRYGYFVFWGLLAGLGGLLFAILRRYRLV